MSARTIAPVPVNGLPPGVYTGPLGARLVAQLIDAAVPAGLLTVLLTGDRSVATVVLLVLLIVAWLLVVWAMVAVRAASPGMRLVKLQLVGLRDGRPIGWGRVATRQLVLGALTATVVGLLAMLAYLVRHPRRQGWHDLAAGCVMIKQRPLAPAVPRTQQKVTRPVPAPPRPARPQGQPAPLSPPRAAPVTSAHSPADGARAASGSTRLTAPSQTPVPTEARPISQGWLAVLDDGRTLEITGLVLLGRNPQGRPGEEDAELIKVTDESRTVSKTHLAMNVDATGLMVLDRGSTNGSTLTDASGVSSPCLPGEVVRVADGTIVSFGDHWLRVEHHPEGQPAER